MSRALADHAPHVKPAAREWLVRRTTYGRVDVADGDAVRRLVRRATRAEGAPVVVFVALPTDVVPAAVTAVHDASLPRGSRVAIENPFGEDAAGAAALNECWPRPTPTRCTASTTSWACRGCTTC